MPFLCVRLAFLEEAIREGAVLRVRPKASDIGRLLKERPLAKGLTAPGMPIGSLGMEIPSGRKTSYDVLLVGREGSTSIFATHPGAQP